jgi:hypothetical protein
LKYSPIFVSLGCCPLFFLFLLLLLLFRFFLFSVFRRCSCTCYSNLLFFLLLLLLQEILVSISEISLLLFSFSWFAAELQIYPIAYHLSTIALVHYGYSMKSRMVTISAFAPTHPEGRLDYYRSHTGKKLELEYEFDTIV